jgi:CHAT domain-containing protein
VVSVTTRASSLSLAGAVLLLAACGTTTDSASPGGADALRDMTGAACRLSLRSDIAPDPGAPAPFYITCGTGQHPNGAVSAVTAPLALPQDAARRHAMLEKAAAASPAGTDAAARMICRDGAWTKTADGLDLRLQPCTLIDGGWPQVAATAVIGPYLLQGEGLPAMLPVIETAMAETAGRPPAAARAAFGGTAAAKDVLAATFGPQLRPVGAADFDRFASLTESARLNSSRNNFRAAEDAYREALTIQERAFGPDAPGVGETLMSLALEVSNQGRFEEAAALFRRADPIIQRSPNPADRARFFSYMAYDAANAGRFGDALPYASEATATWRRLVGDDAPDLGDLTAGVDEARAARRGELAHALNLEAAMALRVGRLADAEAAAKEALGIIGEEHGLPPWWRPEVLTTIGEVYAAENRLSDAEESFRGALIFQQRLFGETAPTAVTLLALGRVYSREGLHEEALHAFTFALKILERNPNARAQLVFDQIAPLLTSAGAIAEQHPDRRAELDATMFRAVQLIATGVADQTISRASARLAAGNPAIEKLVRDLQDADRHRDAARIQLARETSLPDDERGAVTEANLLAEINRQNTRRDTLLATLQKEFPAYAGLLEPGPAELPALQARLHPDEAMIVFEIGRERSSVLVVRAHGFAARPLDVTQATLDRAVRDLRRAFVLRAGGVDEFDLTDAYALYRTLFGPIAGDLAGIDHVIVVANGSLASLPLSLLVTEPPPAGGHDYRHAAWLVRRFAMSDAPSARAFLALRASAAAAQAPKPFFGVGAPAFEGAAAGRVPAGEPGRCQDAGPTPARVLRALTPLPETAGELRAVSAALGAGPDSILTGAAATEAAVRAKDLGDYRVLYFATHGLLPGELSCESEPGLALSPPPTPARSRGEDGLLEASEIAGLPLNADLVVLSACNTAEAATGFGGEALSGLADAFFYAGARSLIASHWEVPSAATVRLMTGVFQRLGPDLSGGAAAALRQAQLQLIDQPATAHPFFWAAFTVIGDGAARSGVEKTAAVGTRP